jgi:oxygen-dependent protoporphyrinogen oxidase
MIGPVSPPAARAIGSLRYNPLAIVHLRADTDLRGLGYQMGLGERQATRGVTFNDSLFGRTGVYTSFLGGSRSPEIVDLGDRALGELAAAEFKAVTGYGAAPMAVFRTAMPAWDDSWRNTRNLQLPDGLFLAANWESRPGIIGRLDQARRLAALLAG